MACVEEINSNPEGLWVHAMWRVLTATRPLNCGNPHGEFAAELSGMLQSPQRAATCRCGKLLWRGCLYLCNFLCFLCVQQHVYMYGPDLPSLAAAELNKRMNCPHLQASLE